MGPLPDPPPPPPEDRSFPPFLGLADCADSSLFGADVFWEVEDASCFMEVGWPPSCSLSFPKPALVFSPSASPPSLFISFSTGFLMGPALLLALLPPVWLEGLWSDAVLEESSPPRELFPPPALFLRPCEDPPPVLLLPGRGPHWVSVLCSRPPLWFDFGWGCCC